LFQACFMSLVQDIKGEEACRTQPWIDSRISVPIAIGLLLLVVLSWFVERKVEKLDRTLDALKRFREGQRP
jgi:glucose-6-phosphate isomerase